jgi:hypothetical protein
MLAIVALSIWWILDRRLRMTPLLVYFGTLIGLFAVSIYWGRVDEQNRIEDERSRREMEMQIEEMLRMPPGNFQ